MKTVCLRKSDVYKLNTNNKQGIKTLLQRPVCLPLSLPHFVWEIGLSLDRQLLTESLASSKIGFQDCSTDSWLKAFQLVHLPVSHLLDVLLSLKWMSLLSIGQKGQE